MPLHSARPTACRPAARRRRARRRSGLAAAVALVSVAMLVPVATAASASATPAPAAAVSTSAVPVSAVSGSAAPVGSGVCLLPPIDAPVIDPFRMPACPYCPGNRGIEYGPAPGTEVVAAAGGEVGFAGTVAGVRWIVVRQTDGLLASYGRLGASRVRVGRQVAAGEWIGTSTDRFYFGLRDGDVPVDPTPLLARRRYPTRLVPIDGGPARPVGPGRLVCPGLDLARTRIRRPGGVPVG